MKQEKNLYPASLSILGSSLLLPERPSTIYRYPIADISIIPVAVQGDNAAPEMIHALTKAQQFNSTVAKPFDVLIIGRGGGSLEDLWAFNNESLAKEIANCKIPIISAVGHEVDFTIADFVADQRAPTPSVSAEMISPDLNDWIQTLDYYRESLATILQRKIDQQRQRLQFMRKRLRHPKEQLAAQKKQLKHLQQSLLKSTHFFLQQNRKLAKQIEALLLQQHPKKAVQLHQTSLNNLSKDLQRNINNTLKNKRQILSSKASLLNAVNPLSVLSRGYSIVSQKNGDIIKQADEVNVGDEITTQLAEGSLVSIIKTRQIEKL